MEEIKEEPEHKKYMAEHRDGGADQAIPFDLFIKRIPYEEEAVQRAWKEYLKTGVAMLRAIVSIHRGAISDSMAIELAENRFNRCRVLLRKQCDLHSVQHPLLERAEFENWFLRDP